MKVAILDDYQNVALRLADWSAVRRHAEITVFNDHIADPAGVIERLRPFDAICVMRERTPLTREILNLKLIASTGPRSQRRRCHPRGQADAVPRGRHRDCPSCAEQSYQRADRGTRVHADGADSEIRQHIAWSARRRGGPDRSAADAPDSRGRGRCIRGGAVGSRSPLPEARERPRDASHRLRNRRSLSNLLRRRRGQQHGVGRGQRNVRLATFDE